MPMRGGSSALTAGSLPPKAILPEVGFNNPARYSQQRGLAASRRSQHRDEFARANLERYIAERVQSAVVIGEGHAQIADEQDRVRGRGHNSTICHYEHAKAHGNLRITKHLNLHKRLPTCCYAAPRNDIDYGINSFVNALVKSNGCFSKPIFSKVFCMFVHDLRIGITELIRFPQINRSR